MPALSTVTVNCLALNWGGEAAPNCVEFENDDNKVLTDAFARPLLTESLTCIQTLAVVVLRTIAFVFCCLNQKIEDLIAHFVVGQRTLGEILTNSQLDEFFVRLESIDPDLYPINHRDQIKNWCQTNRECGIDDLFDREVDPIPDQLYSDRPFQTNKCKFPLIMNGAGTQFVYPALERVSTGTCLAEMVRCCSEAELRKRSCPKTEQTAQKELYTPTGVAFFSSLYQFILVKKLLQAGLTDEFNAYSVQYKNTIGSENERIGQLTREILDPHPGIDFVSVQENTPGLCSALERRGFKCLGCTENNKTALYASNGWFFRSALWDGRSFVSEVMHVENRFQVMVASIYAPSNPKSQSDRASSQILSMFRDIGKQSSNKGLPWVVQGSFNLGHDNRSMDDSEAGKEGSELFLGKISGVFPIENTSFHLTNHQSTSKKKRSYGQSQRGKAGKLVEGPSDGAICTSGVSEGRPVTLKMVNAKVLTLGQEGKNIPNRTYLISDHFPLLCKIEIEIENRVIEV